MKRLSFMLIAGETSGDTLAAELVRGLRDEVADFQSRPTSDAQPLWASLEPRFFGAGGPNMTEAGVALEVDMTTYSVFGLLDVLKRYWEFRRLMARLTRLAIQRQPDVIVCVDFSGFNRRFAHAVKAHVRAQTGTFNDWNPKLVQFVSPQVWASRPGRAESLARDLDLLLSIFPFEKAWYAKRVPQLKVEFVGHPMIDRYGKERQRQKADDPAPATPPSVLLLPGSRVKELKRHLPVMVEAVNRIAARRPVAVEMVLPNEHLVETARVFLTLLHPVPVRVGGLPDALARADLAIASSGTVTLECAFFRVPTVVLYKLSELEFQVAQRIVRVSHIAMPNLLAGETVFPEFIQQSATAERLAEAGLKFLEDGAQRRQVRGKLDRVVASLGGPGASQRAARAIVKLLAGP